VWKIDWYSLKPCSCPKISHKECHSSNVALLLSETGDLIVEPGILLYLYFSLSVALVSDSKSKSELLLDESELSELLISPLMPLPTLELDLVLVLVLVLVLELELELEELSPVPATSGVDAGIA
jgi:hypothetical protein